MRLFPLLAAAPIVLLTAGDALAQCTDPPTDGPRNFRVIDTPLGSMTIRLFDRPGEAPNTVANFLTYADAGDYDTSFFHRLIPNLVIQGGGFLFDPVAGYDEMPTHPPIANEPGICNVLGTVAMARGGSVDSATSQFFINLGDNTDVYNVGAGAYTVFAQVIAQDLPVVEELGLLHREFGTLLIDDPIAIRDLADETFANVPVLEVAERPVGGWGCIGNLEPDPILIVVPPFPVPVWLPAIEDNCGGDETAAAQARALMRTDMGPKINEQLVLMTVPEVGLAWQGAAALAALAFLGLRGRGRH